MQKLLSRKIKNPFLVVFSYLTLVICLSSLLFAGQSSAQSKKKNFVYRAKNGRIVITDREYGEEYFQLLKVFETKKIKFLLSKGHYYKKKYHSYIVKHAHINGLEPSLVHAVIEIESGYDFLAVSPKGAKGLMQLMDETAESLGVSNVFDPYDNIRAGTKYLGNLFYRYNKNLELALAAYNAGPTPVDRYKCVPPYRETRDYIKKIKKVLAGYSLAEKRQEKLSRSDQQESSPKLIWKKENGKIVLKHAEEE